MIIPQEATKRILIVEDSLGISQAIQRALGMYRDGAYQVGTCDSSEAALKWLHETRFDLLITDLRLPGMDGLELLERARKIRPDLRTVLITAYGSPDVEARARSLANAYLSKPFRLQELIRVVDRVLTEPAQDEKPIEPEKLVQPIQSAPPLITGLPKNTHLIVLACDFDGTLAEDGQITPETWELLRAARAAGFILILVTGRNLDSFITEHPIIELCEAIVAENGAVVHFPYREIVALPFGQLDPLLLKEIDMMGVPFQRGMAIAATFVPHDETVLNAIREIRGGVTIEYNREAVMILPPGVSKGNGLLYALHELGYSPRNVVVCGDAENDRSLFQAAELSVAVSNAHPGLKMIADVVLPKPDGAGIQLLIRDLLEGKTLARREPGSRRVQLGNRRSSAPVYLDPFALVENNLGIFGSSGSGKSWLAGLIAEELLKQDYQVCLIDPEGDYRGLSVSPHTLLLGGRESSLPSVSDVTNFCELNPTSVILDLSLCMPEERVAYVGNFLRAMRGMRRRRGRPHCFLVDEIQSFCPPDGSGLTDLLLESMQSGGFSLISYRVSQVAPAVLSVLDHFLVTRLSLREEQNALLPHLHRFEGGHAVLETLKTLPRGQAYLGLNTEKTGSGHSRRLVRFRVGPRSIPHIRHLHKYLRAPLPESKRFYFHDRTHRYLGRSAANLWEFREALHEVPSESLQYHLQRDDFEQWLQNVFHDDELARQVREIAKRNLEKDALRQALLDVVNARYEELDRLS